MPIETQLGALPIESTQTAPSVADPEQCARLYELADKLAKAAASVPKANDQSAGVARTPPTGFFFNKPPDPTRSTSPASPARRRA